MFGRRLNPTNKKFTWMRKKPFAPDQFSKARLDRVYTSATLLPSTRTCEIISCSLSDHSAVHLRLKLPSPQHRGSAYWQFNNSLLDDKNYRSVASRLRAPFSSEATLTARLILLCISRPGIVPESQWLSKIV